METRNSSWSSALGRRGGHGGPWREQDTSVDSSGAGGSNRGNTTLLLSTNTFMTRPLTGHEPFIPPDNHFFFFFFLEDASFGVFSPAQQMKPRRASGASRPESSHPAVTTGARRIVQLVLLRAGISLSALKPLCAADLPPSPEQIGAQYGHWTTTLLRRDHSSQLGRAAEVIPPRCPAGCPSG